MTTFKVGDRVSVYGSVKNKYEKLEYWRGKKCQIGDSPFAPGEYNVFPDGDMAWPVTVHPKQCRRLVKRKRREIWVNEFEHGGLSYPYTSNVLALKSCKENNYIRTIRFVEAKEKK